MIKALMRPAGDYKFAALVALILLAEAVAIIPFAGHHIIGVDGQEYVRYARNLVDHGVYSRDRPPSFEPSMYRTPGYPLFLAALRLIGGDSVVLVRIVQFALLGVLVWLVYAIGLQLGDRLAARIASLLCVTYLPFLWIARMHLTETVTSVLVSATVLLLLQSRERAGPGRHVAIGALIAATALVRPVYALAVVPVVLGIVLWRGDLSWGQVALRTLALGTAFALVLVPWTLRNLSLSHEIRPFGVGGGGTSVLASAMQYAGTVGYRWDAADLHRLNVVEAPTVRRAYREAALEKSDVPLSIRREIDSDRNARNKAKEILRHVSTGEMLRRIPKRLAYLWAVSDYSPTSHYGLWHNLARLQHLALLVFALIGFIVGLARLGLRVLWPVALFPAYLMVLHLYVHSEGRYSLPVRPALMALAGLGAAASWHRFRSRAQPAGTAAEPRGT